eukprot:GSChrysophyteH1.ASY1.ANO1.949.1 assembled CDS
MSSFAKRLANRMRYIVLIGAPGVGKGTFSSIIQAQTGWKHLSLGEHLREEMRSGSHLGEEISGILQHGGLVSNKVANEVTFKRLDHIRPWGPAVLLDGFPRTKPQAEALHDYIASTSDPACAANAVVAVQISLEPWVAEEKLLHRKQCLTCGQNFNTADIVQDGYDMPAILPNEHNCLNVRDGRPCDPSLSITRCDDSLETIRRRMLEFEEKTTPVVDFFKQRGELVGFDVKKGVKDAPDLLNAVLRHLQTQHSASSPAC